MRKDSRSRMATKLSVPGSGRHRHCSSLPTNLRQRCSCVLSSGSGLAGFAAVFETRSMTAPSCGVEPAPPSAPPLSGTSAVVKGAACLRLQALTSTRGQASAPRNVAFIRKRSRGIPSGVPRYKDAVNRQKVPSSSFRREAGKRAYLIIMSPAASIAQASLIRPLRVSRPSADSIQSIRSLRLVGVRSPHCAFAVGAAPMAL